MNYIVDLMSEIAPLGCYCNCERLTIGTAYNGCSNNNYCSTYEICVTPTGAKMSPSGIKSKTQI